MMARQSLEIRKLLSEVSHETSELEFSLNARGGA